MNKYRVGDVFVWTENYFDYRLYGTVTAVDLENNMYKYTIFDTSTGETKDHPGFSINGLEDVTRRLTKLERALK